MILFEDSRSPVVSVADYALYPVLLLSSSLGLIQSNTKRKRNINLSLDKSPIKFGVLSVVVELVRGKTVRPNLKIEIDGYTERKT
jgi:hypothetical protein